MTTTQKQFSPKDLTTHVRRRRTLYADADGYLFEPISGDLSTNSPACIAVIAGAGEPVALKTAEPPTLAELDRLEAERIARLDDARERRRAGIRSLERAPLTLADLFGAQLPTLREAVLLLDEFECLGVDKGQVAIRLPVNHHKRPKLLAAARVVFTASDVVVAHIAAKKPLGGLPDRPLLADGSVAK